MKPIIIFSAWVLIKAGIFAQGPDSLSYQAIVRDATGTLARSHSVGMRVSILQGSESGEAIYVETHTATTNTNGLLTIIIGGGTTVSGIFDTIHWAVGPFFLKTETDPAGGTDYTITGTSQLLSVPYALYAKTANAHYIGELYGGGIVYYVYDNGQHGLIVASSDQSSACTWRAGTDTYTMARANGLGAGKKNTAIIIANQSNGDDADYAARVCNEYSVTVDGVTYGDWYLPSLYELSLLYPLHNEIGGISDEYYWSSTEVSFTGAKVFDFAGGNTPSYIKSATWYVRAIRAF